MLNKLFIERVIYKKATLLNNNMTRFNDLIKEVIKDKKEYNELTFKNFNLFNHYTSLLTFKKSLQEIKTDYIEAYERELIDFYQYTLTYKYGKVKKAFNMLKMSLLSIGKSYEILVNRFEKEVVTKRMKNLKIYKKKEKEKKLEKENKNSKKNYIKKKKNKK